MKIKLITIALVIAAVLFSALTPAQDQLQQKRKEIDILLQAGIQQSGKLFDAVRSYYAVEVFTAVPTPTSLLTVKEKVTQFEKTLTLFKQQGSAELLATGIKQLEELSKNPEAACLVDINHLQLRLLKTCQPFLKQD